jgi:hypothetical protein
MAYQFEVRIDTTDGPGNVLVTDVGNYFEVDGLAIESLRLPKDAQTLGEISQLIAHLVDRAFGVDDDGPRIY